jgi:hypothetical protein
MATGWDRPDGIIAQRIDAAQIGGFFSKKIHVGENEAAIIEQEGKSLQTFGEGKHKVSGLFSRPEKKIVLIDKSPKIISREVKDLWTRQDKKINAAVEIRLVVNDAAAFIASMMESRDIVKLDEIWAEIQGAVSTDALQPVVKKKGIDELQGDRDTVKEIQVSAEVSLRKKLETTGLELLSFSIKFILPGEYEEYLRKRSQQLEEEEKEKAAEELRTRKAVLDREIGEMEGTVEDREKVLDDAEKERIRRETELGIEEEETQEDMRDAMEALKLKEIKDKQVALRDSERKHLGLGEVRESSEEKKGLVRRYGELLKIIEETEKNFYQRKVDEETFKKLMQKYRQEKTELEVKMKKTK